MNVQERKLGPMNISDGALHDTLYQALCAHEYGGAICCNDMWNIDTHVHVCPTRVKDFTTDEQTNDERHSIKPCQHLTRAINPGQNHTCVEDPICDINSWQDLTSAADGQHVLHTDSGKEGVMSHMYARYGVVQLKIPPLRTEHHVLYRALDRDNIRVRLP